MLTPGRRAEWERLVGELAALRVPTNLDRAALAAYCGACALWAEATVQIEKYGALIKSPVTLPGHRQPPGRDQMCIATTPPDGGSFAILDDPPDEAVS